VTQVLSAEISVTQRRIGRVTINHEGLIVCCEICVYNDEKLWIRMPEFWPNKQNKIRLAFWESKELSDQKQELILKKVFDMLDLNVEKAVQLRKDFFTTRKELTKQENNSTLQRKNTET
jgi:hypothetical protein